MRTRQKSSACLSETCMGRISRSCQPDIQQVFREFPVGAVCCLIVYLVVQFVENQFIYPRVVGGSVGLPPLYTIIAAMIGGELFGIIGIIFFIPIMAVVIELMKEEESKMVKQTAGRDQLGDFAPKFAQLNDDVLFGEVWNREDKLSLRERSLVTVVSLMAQGLVDSSFQYHLMSAKNNGITKEEIAEILTHAAFYAGWPKAWAAFKMAKEVWTEETADHE